MQLDTIVSRLHRLSGRLLLKILLRGTPLVLAAAAGWAVISFLLDYALRVPTPVRGVFMLLGAGLVGFVALRHLIRPLLRRPSVDELALMVERADPGIRDQLISAVQLERDLESGRAVESPELIRALVSATAERFRGYPMSRAVSLGACSRPLFGGLAAAVLIGGLVLAFPAESGLWVQRQLLLKDTPWPRETELVITIPDVERYSPEQRDGRTVLHVPERTPLEVRVTAKGVLPAEVELVTSTPEQPELSQPISMGRPQDRTYFQHIFPPLARSLVFHARGGDDDDGRPVYVVHVDRAPRVTAFQAHLDYPGYTGLEDRTLTEPNLAAPEGTAVTFRFTTNMAMQEFVLAFEKGGEHRLQPDENGSYQHTFTVTGSDFYTYRMRGVNGVKAPEAPRYVLTAEVDQPPRILVDLPEQTDLLVTPRAALPLKGRAMDDFGVTEVGFRWGDRAKTLDYGARDFQGKELLDPPGGRTVGFFAPVPVSELVVPAEAGGRGEDGMERRPPREGDRMTLVFRVADNRRTEARPEPHRVFGDFEYRLQVAAAEEIERELTQRQTQLKRWAHRLAEMVLARVEASRGFLDNPEGGGEEGDAGLRSRLLRMEQEQGRVTQELVNLSRLYLRVYDGYLWNRLDPGNLTERLISVFTGLYREPGEAEKLDLLGQAVDEVRPVLDENEAMGRLTIILDLLVRGANERSPRAHQLLARAGLVTGADERERLLQEALAEQEQLYQEILMLSEKLKEWEDYMEVVQKIRDLMESQKGIADKIERLTRKGEDR